MLNNNEILLIVVTDNGDIKNESKVTVQVVAEDEGKVVGYLLATKNVDPVLKRNNFWIDYVCVDSNCLYSFEAMQEI